MLDLNIGVMLIEAGIFLVTMILLKKWLFDPLVTFMDEREKKLQKDDTFLNYFKQVIFLLKTKKFENSYQILLKDSFFREKLIK